jgi:HK97 family phage major capsid protein
MDEKKFQNMLKGMINEMIDNKTKDEAVEIAAETNEKMAKLMEQNAELKAKMEALENAPAKKVRIATPGDTKDVGEYFYKGYDLRNQGAKLDISNERKELYAKFLIDMIGKASMAGGAAATGGNIVPVEYENEILRFATLNSLALQDCTVISMNRSVMKIPTLASGVSVAWEGEADIIAQSDPEFGQVTLTAQKLAARSISSNELLADASYDIVSLLTEQFAEAIALEIDDSVFNGGGGSTMTGALSGAGNTLSCSATGTSPNRHVQITEAELSEAISKLTDNKLRGAKFYLHQNSMHYVRVLADDNGSPIFARPGNGVPGTIYEYPYAVSGQVGSASPGAATPFILFGNLKNYILGRRKGDMSIQVNPWLLWNTDQTSFRVTTRWDGAVGLAAGLVSIKTHA